MSEKQKHKWNLYLWKIKLKSGSTNSFNMPHLVGGKMEEPTEEDIKSFVRNFIPSIYNQIESCSWELVNEYED